MRRRDRRCALDVIAVAMGHEDAVEARRTERGLQVGEMPGRPHAGVDERRRSAVTDDQVGVVAGSRHRPGIVRRQENRFHPAIITAPGTGSDLGLTLSLYFSAVSLSLVSGAVR